jgi:hypothetical protein
MGLRDSQHLPGAGTTQMPRYMSRVEMMLPKTKRPAARIASVVAARRGDQPDLQTQFEALLDQVWRCEAEWKFDDRIDVALHLRRR